jgi:hypothetical protein
MTPAFALRLAEAAKNEYFRTADAELRNAIGDRVGLLNALVSALRYEETAREAARYAYKRARELSRGGAS